MASYRPDYHIPAADLAKIGVACPGLESFHLQGRIAGRDPVFDDRELWPNLQSLSLAVRDDFERHVSGGDVFGELSRFRFFADETADASRALLDAVLRRHSVALESLRLTHDAAGESIVPRLINAVALEHLTHLQFTGDALRPEAIEWIGASEASANLLAVELAFAKRDPRGRRPEGREKRRWWDASVRAWGIRADTYWCSE